MPKATKKRPIRWIVPVICLIVVAGALLAWQKNNIKALWLMVTADEQSLVDRKTEQEQFRQDVLDRYDIADTKDTLEQELATENGELNVDAFLENVEKPWNTQDAEKTESASNAGESKEDAAEPPKADTVSKEESDKVIQQCIAALYVLEDQYVAKLNAVVEETKNEYHQLPEDERTRSKKLALVNAKKDTLLAMERNCDAEVEKLLQRIRKELDRQGEKSDLVTEIRQAYEESKATWKASCLTALSK